MASPPTNKTALPRGFAGSFDDQVADGLDLNSLLISHPASTFFMRVDGDGLVSEGAEEGDVVIVDRSLTAVNEDIVVAIIEGEFLLKQFVENKTETRLLSHCGDNSILLDDESEIEIWGVVTASIRQFRR